MSEISDEAWERAARERVDFSWHGAANEHVRYYMGDSSRITRAAAAEAQAKIDQAGQVTDEEMGRAWALYCEENLHDDFSPESLRRILIALKEKKV